MKPTKEVLSVWTVYDHPRDFPDCYVARRHIILAKGPKASADIVKADSLAELREIFQSAGLYRLKREPGDDPNIIESWI